MQPGIVPEGATVVRAVAGSAARPVGALLLRCWLRAARGAAAGRERTGLSVTGVHLAVAGVDAPETSRAKVRGAAGTPNSQWLGLALILTFYIGIIKGKFAALPVRI